MLLKLPIVDAVNAPTTASAMIQFAIRRLLFTFLAFFAILVITFALVRFKLNDPCKYGLGEHSASDASGRFTRDYGLDELTLEQFATYVNNLLRGDFDVSLCLNRPASTLLIEQLPTTIKLSVSALVIALLIGVPSGIISAVRHKSRADTMLLTGMNISRSFPVFLFGLLIVYAFSQFFKDTPFERSSIKYLALPAVSLSALPLSNIARMVRFYMLNTLKQDYIRTARAKGLPQNAVVLKHAFRNVLFPLLTTTRLQFGTILGGVILTEVVFKLPGVGQSLLEAIIARDFIIVQAFIIVLAFIYVLFNFFIQLFGALVDPRIRGLVLSTDEILTPWTIGKSKPSSLRQISWRHLYRQPFTIIGIVILVALLFTAVFASQIVSYQPGEELTKSEDGMVHELPCIHLLGCPTDQPQHIMGVDSNGRDLFSRIVHGTRISLGMGFLTVAIAVTAGTILGTIAGYLDGWINNIVMGLMDIILAFPPFLLAVAIVFALDPNLQNAMLAIAIVSMPVYARVVRATVLSVRETEYVEASRALGASGLQILFRRILPNALPPLIVLSTLGVATAILDTAALSFLGLGAQPPTPEWGTMLGSERNQIFSAPHLVFIPGIMISVTVLAFNLLGDGLRDALDPRLVHGSKSN